MGDVLGRYRLGRIGGVGFGGNLYPIRNIFDGFSDSLWGNASLLVIGFLNPAPALGFFNGCFHRTRDCVGIHDNMSIDMTGHSSHRLNQSACRPQKTLVIGIENGDQTDLG